jgi:hypothetical protein
MTILINFTIIKNIIDTSRNTCRICFRLRKKMTRATLAMTTTADDIPAAIGVVRSGSMK